MTTITLRRAGQIAEAITTEINRLTKVVNPSISASRFDNLSEVVRDASALLHDRIARIESLVSALATIRGIVGEANTTSGISFLLTRKAGIDRMLALYTAIYSDASPLKMDVLLKRQEELASSASAYHDNVEVDLLTQQEIDTGHRAVLQLRGELNSIRDQVAQLNAQTTIIIPEMVADIAKDLCV